MYIDESRVMREPFNIQTHKATFVNYLEIVILADGSAVYAVPSHQEKLIALACEKNGWTRQELEAACPPEYYADYMNWLAQVSGAVPVWNEFYLGQPNERQAETILALLEAGLLKLSR